MTRQLRLILAIARACRVVADLAARCELRLLSAAQRCGWQPAEAERITLEARRHNARVLAAITKARELRKKAAKGRNIL